MSNTVVDEQCATIRKYGPTISGELLISSFDLFVSALKEIDTLDMKCTLIGQMISSLHGVPYRNKKLAESQLITHEFFLILRDIVLIDHFRRRQIEDNSTQKLLLNVSGLFMHLCSNINDSNITQFKHLLFHKPLIDELASCLNEISTHGKYFNDTVILRSTSFLLVAFKYFHGNLIKTADYSLIAPLFFAVIQCLCSSYAIDMIKNLEQSFNQKLNDGQILFLSTMPWYLQWYSDYRDPENVIKILRMLLNEFTTWITDCPPDSYRRCSSEVVKMIRHLNFFLVRPVESDNVSVLCEEFYDDYCKLVLYWSLILSSTLKCSFDKTNIKLSTRIIVQNLYNFTLHLKVLNFMKTIPNLIPMLLQVTDIEHDEIQLNAYRCLGKIMIEEDIKTMTNPSKIAAVHIEFIMNTIDDPKKTERFYSLLETLKNFVQHDQVKIELIKQKALPLLIKCVVETQLIPIKEQQIALEILLALSFNNDASSVLRHHEKFMSHIQSLIGNSDSEKSGLRRAAERLLWKLEKEEDAITKSTIFNSCRYDIMISYSHRDQGICLQIHEQLVKDGFHVWIDKDCLRGSTMVGIANAIENSQYVIICMSNTYKQSVYCQSEAHYAFERGCRLIPIIIESNYQPDGWLGIIVSGKIYVNFVNVEFKLAYERLKNEINEQRHQNSNQWSTKSEEILQADTVFIRSELIDLASESIIDLPKCVAQWTHNHVKLFLLRIGLGNTILPLCARMDGHHLLQLYEMCLLNHESMYQSLKFELNERHHTLLLIADYLIFLHEIKQYVSLTSANVKPTNSSYLSFTFCNIM